MLDHRKVYVLSDKIDLALKRSFKGDKNRFPLFGCKTLLSELDKGITYSDCLAVIGGCLRPRLQDIGKKQKAKFPEQ